MASFKTITINWLRGSFPLNGLSRTDPGVYIIYLRTKPIYVGSAHQQGLSARLKNWYGRLNSMRVKTENYKAKVGILNNPGKLIKIGTGSEYENVSLAEKIIIRSLYVRDRSLITNERHKRPFNIPQRTKLKLEGYPPGALVRALNWNTGIARKEGRFTYIIYKDTQYESFAHSLTLPELRELEWV